MFNKKIIALVLVTIFAAQPAHASWKDTLASSSWKETILAGCIAGMVVDMYDMYSANSARKSAIAEQEKALTLFRALATQGALLKTYDEVSGDVELTQVGDEVALCYGQAFADHTDAVSQMKRIALAMAFHTSLGTWAGYKLYHS